MGASSPMLRQRALALAAALLPAPLSPPLRAARTELRRALRLAFSLASAHRRPVVLETGRRHAEGQLGLSLPPGVLWGCPPATPLPPSLCDTGWGDGFPRPITVMPRRGAVANVWFLHHGREALCLHLRLSGAVELLRFRPRLGAWTPC